MMRSSPAPPSTVSFPASPSMTSSPSPPVDGVVAGAAPYPVPFAVAAVDDVVAAAAQDHVNATGAGQMVSYARAATHSVAAITARPGFVRHGLSPLSFPPSPHETAGILWLQRYRCFKQARAPGPDARHIPKSKSDASRSVDVEVLERDLAHVIVRNRSLVSSPSWVIVRSVNPLIEGMTETSMVSVPLTKSVIVSFP